MNENLKAPSVKTRTIVSMMLVQATTLAELLDAADKGDNAKGYKAVAMMDALDEDREALIAYIPELHILDGWRTKLYGHRAE